MFLLLVCTHSYSSSTNVLAVPLIVLVLRYHSTLALHLLTEYQVLLCLVLLQISSIETQHFLYHTDTCVPDVKVPNNQKQADVSVCTMHGPISLPS